MAIRKNNHRNSRIRFSSLQRHNKAQTKRTMSSFVTSAQVSGRKCQAIALRTRKSAFAESRRNRTVPFFDYSVPAETFGFESERSKPKHGLFLP
jgi:hypothetical protein